MPLRVPAQRPSASRDAQPPVGETAAAFDVPPTVRIRPGTQTVSLAVLATIGVVFALEWAQLFVITLLLGLLFAYTLNPLVVWLEQIRIPRALGSTVVMAGVVCALTLGAYSLRGQFQTILDQVPGGVSKVSAGLASVHKGETSTMQKVQTAASEIEKATSQAAGIDSTPRRPATRVVIDTPGFKLGDFLLANSVGAVGLIGQAAMVLFLTFFLLLSGDTYKRKLVRLAGPTLANRKITVRILDDINASVQRYMSMLLATNVLVALLTWLALRLIGLENAGAWAVAAGLLHVIPYFGPAVTAAAIGMAAFMQFDTLSMALLPAGASLAVATFVGTFVTTWMTGRIARMNTAAVFVSLLFWAWLWGIWGMLLSIPITVILKVVAQHVEQLEPVAELLGE
ncbi:MAG: Transport of quorum-sensing signal protein [Candidatus Accumulibacter regalis]|jgi:predicted PurR-regulated permease PerM|uniref:Transport of quorum-sensing signal protein n=1 Tax=Accumulibacter regalis TaxID=522306 RepID=A0A011QMJ6_ACCRE|nr:MULTISPECIES: AI-2E family transporter [unclassified Candidatus Accumulibacter]EXI90265.1 MAG: Transport of quorum-sensing signal protein [Candidatus Accumulibacter regalis]MQM33826.1 AI-2E family transporter [Candidatus Accumulibacter phosphatis]MBL8368716.1 AI-2E family transporter [Accumulibacter sp.]MBN8513162.1 AI-2E family transporter [Accumulibacter sp.]MBO3702477.1 AI-2E family transporter [Accumulibacter sp.]